MKPVVSAGMVAIAVVALCTAIVVLSVLYWCELKGTDSAGATLRNIGVVGGGLIAIVLALWHSSIARRQVDDSERDSLDAQFQKAAGMLGHNDLFMRIGGIVTLYHLGCNHLNR